MGTEPSTIRLGAILHFMSMTVTTSLLIIWQNETLWGDKQRSLKKMMLGEWNIGGATGNIWNSRRNFLQSRDSALTGNGEIEIRGGMGRAVWCRVHEGTVAGNIVD